MQRNNSTILTLILIFSALTKPTLADGPKWQASVPPLMKDSVAWTPFLDHLIENNLNFGAMVSAYRMLIFFTDVSAKEAAYRAVIKIIDRGYPFSAQRAFVTGDITPKPDDYAFYNSYNLYKAIVNKLTGSERWSEAYFQNIDKENFSKYLFYQALDAYSKNNLPKSEELLKKILAKETGEPEKQPFVRKVARSLARVYFDQEQYEKSLEIYTTFLLKLNPITPTDWVESAWNLYHLKRYPETLGTLYNMESKANDGNLDLEKYTIRALVYRELCAGDQAESLIQSFDKDFGTIINGIKRGEPLSKYPVLRSIALPQTEEYRQITGALAELRAEYAHISELPRKDQSLAIYIYTTEIKAQQQRLLMYQDTALEEAANALVTLSEQLKFLRYDVAREKFNPDVVFKPLDVTKRPLIENFEDTYTLRWAQFGDFWRDERPVYKGILENRCTE